MIYPINAKCRNLRISNEVRKDNFKNKYLVKLLYYKMEKTGCWQKYTEKVFVQNGLLALVALAGTTSF